MLEVKEKEVDKLDVINEMQKGIKYELLIQLRMLVLPVAAENDDANAGTRQDRLHRRHRARRRGLDRCRINRKCSDRDAMLTYDSAEADDVSDDLDATFYDESAAVDMLMTLMPCLRIFVATLPNESAGFNNVSYGWDASLVDGSAVLPTSLMTMKPSWLMSRVTRLGRHVFNDSSCLVCVAVGVFNDSSLRNNSDELASASYILLYVPLRMRFFEHKLGLLNLILSFNSVGFYQQENLEPKKGQNGVLEVTVSASLTLVLVWIWKRFPSLRPRAQFYRTVSQDLPDGIA
ncbi:hypothetical protein Pfo_011249 [Paulownia fortunei]|nr:hypothetical protein Pfo_011249 [Paulownia fortunei]